MGQNKPQISRGVSWGRALGPAAPGVTKGAPKLRKRKGKEERERGKEREKKEGTKWRKDRTVNLYKKRGTIQRQI